MLQFFSLDWLDHDGLGGFEDFYEVCYIGLRLRLLRFKCGDDLGDLFGGQGGRSLGGDRSDRSFYFFLDAAFLLMGGGEVFADAQDFVAEFAQLVCPSGTFFFKILHHGGVAAVDSGVDLIHDDGGFRGELFGFGDGPGLDESGDGGNYWAESGDDHGYDKQRRASVRSGGRAGGDGLEEGADEVGICCHEL